MRLLKKGKRITRYLNPIRTEATSYCYKPPHKRKKEKAGMDPHEISMYVPRGSAATKLKWISILNKISRKESA